jgi:hypothetical protein
VKPNHRPRPDPYPYELGELYCDEDETLCVPCERPCLCCYAAALDEADDQAGELDCSPGRPCRLCRAVRFED